MNKHRSRTPEQAATAASDANRGMAYSAWLAMKAAVEKTLTH